MGILNDLRGRIAAVNEGLQTGRLVGEVLSTRGADILERQRIQLFEGKASSGEDLRPYYSEDLKPDGYFHSVESAGRYSAWKASMSYPYTVERNPDAPNLYINGRFHSELEVQFNADSVGIVPSTSYARGIMEKYVMSSFGLTGENWSAVLVEGGAYDELMENIRRIVYGND